MNLCVDFGVFFIEVCSDEVFFDFCDLLYFYEFVWSLDRFCW